MVDYLEPAGSGIILWLPTRCTVDSDLVPETDFAHVHLMIPRVACVRPLDESRVKCQTHPCWDVTCRYVVIPFTGQVLSGKIPSSVCQDITTLILNGGVRVELDKSLLQILLILSPYSAAYPVYNLSPNRETRSASFLRAGATRPAERHLRLV
jgi:hypothetical protein